MAHSKVIAKIDVLVIDSLRPFTQESQRIRLSGRDAVQLYGLRVPEQILS